MNLYSLSKKEFNSFKSYIKSQNLYKNKISYIYEKYFLTEDNFDIIVSAVSVNTLKGIFNTSKLLLFYNRGKPKIQMKSEHISLYEGVDIIDSLYKEYKRKEKINLIKCYKQQITKIIYITKIINIIYVMVNV